MTQPNELEPAHDLSIEVIATDLVTGQVVQRLEIPLVRPRDNAPFNIEARYDQPDRINDGWGSKPVVQSETPLRKLSIHVGGISPREDGGPLYTLIKYPPPKPSSIHHTSTGRIR